MIYLFIFSECPSQIVIFPCTQIVIDTHHRQVVENDLKLSFNNNIILYYYVGQ